MSILAALWVALTAIPLRAQEPPPEAPPSVAGEATVEAPAEAPPPVSEAPAAVEAPVADAPAPMDEGDSDEEALPEQKPPPKKPSRPRQVYGNKEVEGTRALDRGQVKTDALIRSRYTLNGEYLEVDPD